MFGSDALVREWGPALWRTLHTVSFAYPEAADEAERQGVRAFLVAFEAAIPCPECRSHYRHHLRTLDAAALAGRDGLSRWAFEFHESVNRRTGKAPYPGGYDALAHAYLHYSFPWLIVALTAASVSLVAWATLASKKAIGSTGSSRTSA